MRKKLFLVAVCVAVLIIAVGVYAYVMNSAKNKTFVFEWSAEEQNLVNGTLRMELTFAVKGGNLNVLAKINDREYDANSTSCTFVMVFDMNKNGTIDYLEYCYVFYSGGRCRSPALTNNSFWNGHGGYLWGCSPVESPYHTFTRDELHSVFKISIPLEELDLVNDLVIVSFLNNYGNVWKEFNFGLEV
jgi:hypothetical protein